MSKWFKFFLIGMILCLSVSTFAQSISYQRVVDGVSNVYRYVFSKQATTGAFVSEKNDKRFFSASTVMVLYQLRQLEFPTDTLAFAKGVNFLDENYHLSKTNDSYSLYVLLNLQGRTKLNLSNCAQFLKGELVRDYLLSAMAPPETKSSSVNYYTRKLLLIPLILNMVKYSNEKDLVRILNAVPNNVQVHQVDVDDMLASSLANLYENLSKMVLNAYSEKNAVMAFYTQARINDVLLNGYGKKVKEEEMKYIKWHASGLLNNSDVKKMIEDAEVSQRKDGSWDIDVLGGFQNSNIKSSQIGFVKVEITAMNVYSLLKCGVPATNSTVERGVEYLVNKLSNPTFLNENPEFLQGFVMPVKALESYLNTKWGRHYDVGKESSSKYLKYMKLDKAKFSDLLSKMYVSGMKSYISQVIFGK